MSIWLSSHGAGAIKASGTSFSMTVSEIGAEVQPTSANEHNGILVFPLTGLPRHFSHLKAIGVDLFSDGEEPRAHRVRSPPTMIVSMAGAGQRWW
jgi:hypothetical protein